MVTLLAPCSGPLRCGLSQVGAEVAKSSFARRLGHSSARGLGPVRRLRLGTDAGDAGVATEGALLSSSRHAEDPKPQRRAARSRKLWCEVNWRHRRGLSPLGGGLPSRMGGGAASRALGAVLVTRGLQLPVRVEQLRGGSVPHGGEPGAAAERARSAVRYRTSMPSQPWS